MRGLAASLALPLVFLASVAPDALAQNRQRRSWAEEKCERYKEAWSEVVSRRGARGLGPAFLGSHDAFLRSGCTATGDVCPRSDEEIETANVLTIAAMNAGMASTFLPFACRK